MRLSRILATVAAASILLSQAADPPHIVQPPEGLVSSAETAIAIAVAVWIPIYGRATIESEKPYRAQLRDGVWTVEGSLPPGYVGGVAEIDIAKRDGRITRVSHGK